MGKQYTAKVKMTLGEGFKAECEASGKKIIADEPISFGGTDLGMNPIELLLSGLGACKSVVTKMLAKKKRINLEYLEIECIGSFDEKKVGLADVKTIYKIKADVSKEELEKFIELVDKNCPVNDTLKNSPRQESVLEKL